MSEARRGNGCLFLVGAAGVLLVLAGVAYDHWPEGADEPPPSRGLDLAEPSPEPVVVEPSPQPPTIPPPAPIPAAPVEATPIVWHAEVVSHPNLALGTSCALSVDLDRRLDGPAAVRAVVLCDDETVFEGLVGRQDLSELSLGPRGFAYRASLSAMGRGPEHGQSSLTFDSTTRRAAITEPGRSVELYVDDLSVPRTGPAFFVRNERNRPRAWAPVRRAALVRSLDGPVPAALTSARQGNLDCRLSVRPAMSASQSCRVVLRCGSAVLYGAGNSGYGPCEVVDGQVVGMRDEGMSSVDTDPDIDLRLAEGRMVIADDGVDGVWRATLRLEPEPRCEAIQSTLGGRLIGEPLGDPRLVPASTGWTLRWVGPDREEVPLTVRRDDCDSGELALEGPGVRFELTRGFDGTGVAGYMIPAEGPVRSLLLRSR